MWCIIGVAFYVGILVCMLGGAIMLLGDATAVQPIDSKLLGYGVGMAGAFATILRPLLDEIRRTFQEKSRVDFLILKFDNDASGHLEECYRLEGDERTRALEHKHFEYLNELYKAKVVVTTPH